MKKNFYIFSNLLLILLLLLPYNQINALGNPYEKTLDIQSSRSEDWIVGLQENGFDNPQWFFEHLTNEDRQKIRQAFDWAIDRDHIINDIMNGYGNKSLTFIPPSSEYYLNNNTVVRQLDLTKAKNLLTEVFGYAYNPSVNNPATTYDETKPYFSLTQAVPDSNEFRKQWANDIRTNLLDIGVNVSKIEFSMNNLGTFLNNNDSVHGGFDTLFVAWPDDGIKFYSPVLDMLNLNMTSLKFASYTLSTWDYPLLLFNNQNYNEILNNTIHEQDTLERNQDILNYQQWMYDNVPLSLLFRNQIVNVKNKYLQGVNPFVRTNYENWTYNGQKNATIAFNDQYGDQIGDFNPVWTYGYFGDFIGPDKMLVTDALFRGLFYTTTESNDPFYLPTKTYPYFADWYNTSTDGKTWFVNLKEGLRWHDGVELNTSDIKFTFDSIGFTNQSSLTEWFQWLMNGAYKSWNFGGLQINVINSTLIKFTLEHPYSFFKEDILTMKILPKHILENIPLDQWYMDASNKGINQTIIGNGPFTYVNSSTDLTKATLQRWQDWNSSYNTLIATNSMNENVPGASVPALDYINFVYIPNEYDVLDCIKNGSVDVTLQYIADYQFNNIFNQIIDPIVPIIEEGGVMQLVHYNVNSPIWGFHPSEPCSLYTDVSCESTISAITNKTSTTATTSPTTSPTVSELDSVSILFGFVAIVLIAKSTKRKKY